MEEEKGPANSMEEEEGASSMEKERSNSAEKVERSNSVEKQERPGSMEEEEERASTMEKAEGSNSVEKVERSNSVEKVKSSNSMGKEERSNSVQKEERASSMENERGSFSMEKERGSISSEKEERASSMEKERGSISMENEKRASSMEKERRSIPIEKDNRTNSLESLSLAPFKLKWMYGRTSHVNVVNLTGLYKNHIAYASSNCVVIFDYVGNEQHVLQGHKNAITALAMDKKCRFLASCDTGHKCLIIVWDCLTGKALKFFPDPHNGNGCITLAFTAMDYMLATIGNEGPGKQSICIWDFNPHHQKKEPNVIGYFPNNTEFVRELSFSETNTHFFTVTGDRTVIFCTWLRPHEDDKHDWIFFYKPKVKKHQLAKYKQFCHSLWTRGGNWVATSTMSGFVVIWAPIAVLGLEDLPDPKKNVRELSRFYKLSDNGLTFFTSYNDYIVVGDEKGIIRFYDQDMKILRWTKNFYVKSVRSISFNIHDDLPAFKEHLRGTYDPGSKNYLEREGNSRVRDYSMGGTKDKNASMTTISRPPMPCSDFVFSVSGGDVFYYHFRQGKEDLLVNGTPGKFVACDVSPGTNHIVFVTKKGDIQVYDFVTHRLIFSGQLFSGANSHELVSTMKFHPTGYCACFGLFDGRITFRQNFSFKTILPMVELTTTPIRRLVFSEDGLLLSCFAANLDVMILCYISKTQVWSCMGKCRTHYMDIVDLQFHHDPTTRTNRLFSLGLDRYLVEYDLVNCHARDSKSFKVLRILRLEETCQPTSMVFDGPPEFGVDCLTFSNTVNKLRQFSFIEEKVKATYAGPVFGREHVINRMVECPVEILQDRFKKFIIFVRGNKLGIMDTPITGNPHKYMAVVTHPESIRDISVVPNSQQVFTIAHKDNVAIQWEACLRSVESSVLIGGTGSLPFQRALQRNWHDICKDIVKDIDLVFFYFNMRRFKNPMDVLYVPKAIRISEISTVCRVCGFFPSEYEIELMTDEARRITINEEKYTDDATTEFSFDEFIKLFSNHYYRITSNEIEDSFKFLNFYDKGDVNICRSDVVKVLTTEGEALDEKDMPMYFEALLDEPYTVFPTVSIECKLDSSRSVSPREGESEEFDVNLEALEDEFALRISAEEDIEEEQEGSEEQLGGEDDQDQDADDAGETTTADAGSDIDLDDD